MPGLTVFVQRRSETVLRVLGVAFDRRLARANHHRVRESFGRWGWES